MLLVQEFLSNHTFKDLQDQHGVYASFSKSGHKFSLNYDQIEAQENDPLAQECRGLILSLSDDRVICGIAMPTGKLNRDDIIAGKTKILAYPMKRFFNYGQGSAAKINWNDPKLSVMEKLDGCFTYDSLLTCWDGSVVKIGEVVKKKLKPKLIGMNEHGELIPCEITKWFDNGKKNNWLEITTSEISKSKNRKFKITSNHSVNINGKFIPIMQAEIGDKFISWEDNICNWTRHFIKSSLLGDASLSLNGINYKFEEGHTEKHSEFSEQNKKWLGENFSSKRNYISGFGSKMIRVSSRPDPIISEIRKEWYNDDGVKFLPSDLSWIDNFTIAKWYMDDGSLAHDKNQKDRACFATNNFSESEVIRLGEKLKEMYNISYTVYFSKGWCLRINAGRHLEINKMWKAISPYIINCMRYKLPQEYREEKFIYGNRSGLILKIKKEIEILNIRKIHLLSNNRSEFPHGRAGFDIETSTHNYIINNILVHNSLCIMYFDPFTNKYCIATRSVPEADLLMDNGIFTFRTLFEKALTETCGLSFDDYTSKLDKEITYCFELTTPYNRIVVNYPRCGVTLIAARQVIHGMQAVITGETHDSLSEIDINELQTYGVPKVKSFKYNSINELVDWVSTRNPMEHEGVVVRDSDFNRIKIKNAAYVAYNKVRDCLASSPRNCVELILQEKDDDVVSFLPEEIIKNLQLIKVGVQSTIKKYDSAYLEAKAEADLVAPGDKKVFAILVNKNKDLWTAPLFKMFDGQVMNMKDFIAKNRKDGSWSNSFLDRFLEISSKMP